MGFLRILPNPKPLYDFTKISLIVFTAWKCEFKAVAWRWGVRVSMLQRVWGHLLQRGLHRSMVVATSTPISGTTLPSS